MPDFIGDIPDRKQQEPSFNFWQRSALEELKPRGLTAQHLLNRDDGGHWFDSSHCFALSNLVLERRFSIEAALAEIEGLSSVQAESIKRGSTRQDVTPFTNSLHIEALRRLKPCGLTAQHLLNRDDGGHEFDYGHYAALSDLVLERRFSIEAALAEIEGLSSAQATGIKEGLTRQDVLALTNLIPGSKSGHSVKLFSSVQN